MEESDKMKKEKMRRIPMIELFQYNWEVREEWFDWCEEVPHEELVKKRTGGMESILHNLFHVINCEQLWINHMRGEPVIETDMKSITVLEEVKEFSRITKPVTMAFLESYETSGEDRILEVKSSRTGEIRSFSYDKVILHIITHEIHHIGQVSVWSREVGLKPVSSDLIIRDYF
ncbi:DinB family protein [Alteribacter keqinensis]|uniref:Damage-inducible protein DinB n=1 Tax=Alteribacter keqinensis TaxID=2483800 RepID=A0A3M7TNT6_9BACI|nr:DinB family protein [Alteribacter keqinensis]RNA66677.1 hypothetical protein EBO34_15790 [Alteribacter keqinensis]